MNDDDTDRQPDDARTRHERVGAGEDGQRVDNFLLRRAPGVPKSHLYRLIRAGNVRVDGRRVKPARKLVAGEQVRVPPLRLARQGPVRVPDEVAERLAAAVRVRHEDFLIIDKPAGIAVHGGSGLVYGAIDALRQALGEPSLELVHRLDRGTSGALLIARDVGRCRALQALFRERRVEKRYRALLDGHWPAERRRIELPLLANRAHAGERRVIVSEDGQHALSHVALRRHFGALNGALSGSEVDVRIETGRTHQIRVHARASGHAVIGDERYGDNRRNAAFKQRGLARLCLHAESLAFDWQGERHAIDVTPGPAWTRLCEALDSP